MNVDKTELTQVKAEDEVTCDVYNKIKIEMLKNEPWDADFIKCELCIENSGCKTECVHHKNDRLGLGDSDQQQDKLQLLGSYSAKDLQANSSQEELKPKLYNTESYSVQQELFDTKITIKEEDHLDSPEYVSTDMEFVKLEERWQVKYEDEDDDFKERDQCERLKEEPTDDETSPDIVIKGSDNIEDNSSEGLQKDCKAKQCRRPRQVQWASFQCKVCSIVFPVRSSLVLHERTHVAEYPYRCTVCTKYFINNVELIAHEKIHVGEKRIHCNVCSKSFMRSNSLAKHKRTHTGERPFYCKICQKSFAEKSYMSRHERTHTGEKPYNCKVCSKPISDKSNLIKHEKTHIGEKTFDCKVCSKLFSSISHLVRHEKLHAGVKPFHCQICSKSFFQRGNLRMHERTHTGDNPFQCTVCEKSFALKHCLVRHERTHTGEKPFKCSVCSKSFSENSNCTKHEKIHAKEK